MPGLLSFHVPSRRLMVVCLATGWHGAAKLVGETTHLPRRERHHRNRRIDWRGQGG